MKIAISTDGKKGMDEAIADHFGRCKTYTFLDENGKIVEIIDNKSSHMGGQGLPPELIKKHGADTMLCKDIGPKALSLFNDYGIDVYVCRAKTVNDIFELWKNKKLKKAGFEDVCEEHRSGS